MESGSRMDLIDAFDDEPVADWLGIAVYLADAVASDTVDLAAAHDELQRSVTPTDRHALTRAVETCARQLGSESLATSLLRDAMTRCDDSSEAA